MRFLVSVRDAGEARAALAGGADIVDVKDPAGGALGAAAPAVLRAIRAAVGPPVQLSAALGDAPGLAGTFALAGHAAALCGADYVKVGLLGAREPHEALELLRAVRRAAEDAAPRVGVVAVAYADAHLVGAFPPLQLPAVAREAGIRGVLLDTFRKDGTTSLAALGGGPVAAFLEQARAGGLLAGLAGALRLADMPAVRSLGPDVVGVRGSACVGGRQGRIVAERVTALRQALGLEEVAALRAGSVG